MPAPTVLSVGGVSISVSGGVTALMLASVTAALGADPPQVRTPNGLLMPAPANGNAPDALVLPASVGGTLLIPTGYEYVIAAPGGAASILGGTAQTALIGSFGAYTGSAGTVIATDGSGTIIDDATGALIAARTGSHTIVATGIGAKIAADGGTGRISAVGAAAAVTLGAAASVDATATNLTLSALGAADTIRALGGQNQILSGPSAQIIVDGGRNLLVANGTTAITVSGGAVTMFGGQATTLRSAGGDALFVGGGANSSATIQGGDGSDTIYAIGAASFVGGSGSVAFVAGAGAATYQGGSGTQWLYGGSGGGLYTLGTGATYFVGIGGQDTISGNGGGDWLYAGFGGGLTLDTDDANIVVLNNNRVDASDATGTDRFYVVDTFLSGDSTLTGGSAATDMYVIWRAAADSETGSRITITDWSATDQIVLGGAFSAQDVAAASAGLAAGASQLTLSDGLTIIFTGDKPAQIG